MPKLAGVLGCSVEELMQASESAASGQEKKKGGELLALIFKGVALAMGVAVAVLSALGGLETSAALMMLGIGLALLGINSLSENG